MTDRYRESPDLWAELCYEKATGDDGYDYDRNAVRRAQVLWSLQYDRRPQDLPLLRWLARQEAVCRREAPFQGLTDQITLAGALVAEHRQVEDVWLQWEIKRANFDTWCGYDGEHLLAAGVRATLDFVRESGHPDRDEVLEYLAGRSDISEEGVTEWAERQRLTFPDDPADEDPLTLIERAQFAGDRPRARELLDQWAAGRTRDRDTLSTLRYELTELGAFAEAAAAQRDSLAFAESAWDRASAWHTLAELERQADHHDAAWAALSECRRALADVSGWTEVGLGRMYVEELLRLAVAADGDLAARAFTEADRQARDVPRLPLVVWQSAAEAAAKVGDQPRAEHYARLRDEERRRIDHELSD
ncbi:hypothetical protein [Paractinoplanes ovalisporus]|uniref:hypothetical protein n=1 Tax=Paractinoplanes ovalisporus TaxID=2810368 RepID=UPI0027DD1ABA|nr:hypothetical protein [Actinoplanes ovalisporus]